MITIGPITTNANSTVYRIKPTTPEIAVVRDVKATGNFAGPVTVTLWTAHGSASNLTAGSVNFAPVAGGEFTEATTRGVLLTANARVFANSVNANVNAGTNVTIIIEG